MKTSLHALMLVTALASFAIVAPPAMAQDNRADSAVKSDLRNLATELETYYTDHQTYPGARAVTYDGRRQVGIGSATVRLASGDRLGTVRLTPQRDAFCVRVVRAPSAGATTGPWRYLSDRGGITSGGCPGRFSYVSE